MTCMKLLTFVCLQDKNANPIAKKKTEKIVIRNLLVILKLIEFQKIDRILYFITLESNFCRTSPP